MDDKPYCGRPACDRCHREKVNPFGAEFILDSSPPHRIFIKPSEPGRAALYDAWAAGFAAGKGSP